MGERCPFCLSTDLEVQGDAAAMWVHCWRCGASGPTVSRVGSLSESDQRRRAKEKFRHAPR